MKNYKFLIVWLFIFTLFTGNLFGSTSSASAQTDEGWSEPVNLSNSGSSTNPWLVIDSVGTIHAFWLDKFDGYQYVNSTDGVTWTEPKTLQVPFPTAAESAFKPVFLAGPDGVMHILWQDNLGALQYRRSTSTSLGQPSTWTGGTKLADSTVQFDAVMDSTGALHVGYINNIETESAPAGIYYRRLKGTTWSGATNIYPSKYYRSLEAGDAANIQLATSGAEDKVNVYIAWDDRLQRRIFLAKSPDGGNTWDGTFQVRGPEDFSGVEMPYNIDLGAFDDQVLLLWQAGVPGTQCAQFSQWSTDGAKQFGQPVTVLDEFDQCPQSGQFMLSSKDFSVLLFNTFNDLSLMAWDGARWSTQLPQNEISSFINPVTLESVFLGCQNATASNGRIYIVGCDTGAGGDIWFASRPIGPIQEWFPPPSTWTRPVVLTSTGQKVVSLLSVADYDNHVHDVWVQDALEDEDGALIQYARWDGQKWSAPATVISGSELNPSQITLNLDSSGKLLLAWVDAVSGDMYFTWANSDGARSASEWETPIYVPSVSSANSSPDIVTDVSGRMVVAFSVLINEDRGIYIVESEDDGATWSKPYRVFDASAVNWHMVDRPQIALTGDGRLHILMERYTLWGDQRRSIGLYYIESSDGGVTWSQPESASEQPILWSEMVGYGELGLHRIWQEQRETGLVSLHQYSSDGGTTWGAPATVSTITDEIVTNDVSVDLFGNLYYLQLTGPEQPTVLDQRWSEAGWKLKPSMLLDVDPNLWTPSSIVSSVSSNGHLVASLLGDSPDLKSEWQSQILSMSQSLDLPEEVPTPYAAMIAPASVPVVAGTQPVSGQIFETATPEAPLAGIQDTEPFWIKNRNQVGLLLLGAVLVFIILIFLITARPKNKAKKKTNAGASGKS